MKIVEIFYGPKILFYTRIFLTKDARCVFVKLLVSLWLLTSFIFCALKMKYLVLILSVVIKAVFNKKKSTNLKSRFVQTFTNGND